MPKVSNEKVRNEYANNGVFEVFPTSVDELFSRNVVSVNKIGSSCSLVIDMRKGADGFDVDLDHAEFAFLVG